MRGGPLKFNTIMMQMLLLIAGVGLVLTVFNIGIIVFRPPIADYPVTAFEVARLLNRLPVAKPLPQVSVTISASAPLVAPAGNDLIARAIARMLPPGTELRLERDGFPSKLERADFYVRREMQMYGDDANFMPLLVGSFRAAVPLPDGTWLLVTKQSLESAAAWQVQTTFMLLAVLVGALPLAWLFGRRFERPIRELAVAIDKLDKHDAIEPLKLGGPNEIRAAANAVNQLELRLKRFVAERTSLVGAVAHDMRTPLARLKFHLHHAPEDVRDKANKELDEIEKMIEATMEFVDTEGRSRVREKVDLALLVEGAVDDMADLGRNVALSRLVPATLSADPVLLKRMFVNLLNNAVEYGQRAVVSMEIMEGYVSIEVRDNGPGMAPKDLERAFEPFYRAEGSRNRATGGIGLGLAIVKSAAEAHGGKVVLFNVPEGGLCARVLLPLSR